MSIFDHISIEICPRIVYVYINTCTSKSQALGSSDIMFSTIYMGRGNTDYDR